MKIKLFFIVIFNLLLCNLQFSQNITNTLGTNGIFYIKNSSTNYFTLTQSTGQVNILKTLRLENSTNSSTGVIFKGTNSFIHDYQEPGTDGYNTFVGINSGNFTMGGSGVEASYNTGTGVFTLYSITTGRYNSAFGCASLNSNTVGNNNASFGYFSLYSNLTGNSNSSFGNQTLNSNTSGSFNSAFGRFTLYGNTTGDNNAAFGYNTLANNSTADYNSAFGINALFTNTTGSENASFGYNSLTFNTTGNQNSAFGVEALYGSTGAHNSAFGYQSLYANSTGGYNSAFGYQSLHFLTTGSNNVAMGYQAGDNLTTGSNNIIIGYNADVPSNTSNNQVRIGNTSITYAGVQVAWTITSDRKWKSNILNADLGLNFISKLRPVSYTRINDDKQRSEYGFIAQEVEEVLKDEGVENSGMITIDDEGTYNMRYNDLLAPMVKAIQELKERNDKLGTENDKLNAENQNLNERLTKLEQLIKNNSQTVNVSYNNNAR